MLVVVASLALWRAGRWPARPSERFFKSEDRLVPAGACTFPVFIHVVVNNEFQGRVVLEITNLETGTPVIRNVSGPGTMIYEDLLFVRRGSQLFFFKLGDLGLGTPGAMFINRGRVVESLGEPRKIDDAGQRRGGNIAVAGVTIPDEVFGDSHCGNAP